MNNSLMKRTIIFFSSGEMVIYFLKMNFQKWKEKEDGTLTPLREKINKAFPRKKNYMHGCNQTETNTWIIFFSDSEGMNNDAKEKNV